MKKYIFKALFLLLLTNVFSLYAESVNVSGLNETQFIDRDLGDKYKSYFYDKLSLQLQYSKLSAGLKYDYFHPKFDRFLDVDQAGNEENDNYFDDYYLQYESDNLFVKGGYYEASIGSGMILHNYYDKDFDNDTRLQGGYFQFTNDNITFQTFGGIMDNDFDEDKNDFLGAVDFEYNLFSDLKLASAFVLDKINQEKDVTDDKTDKYFFRKIYSGRVSWSSEKFEFKSEYAKSQISDQINSKFKDGHALYATGTFYIGKFTFLTSYKNYWNFNYKLSDLPTVNHSGEPINDSWESGKDEQGLMGELHFVPDDSHSFLVNYAEGWSKNYKIRQEDLYAEYSHDFESSTLKLIYADLEELSDVSTNWIKETTPEIDYDFQIGNFPILIESFYEIVKHDNLSGEVTHYEPKIQTDIGYNNYSFSLTVENQYGDKTDKDDGKYWIGGEFTVSIDAIHSDVRLFAGKEKGGKVCRNGVCRYQSEFQGVKLEINTTF